MGARRRHAAAPYLAAWKPVLAAHPDVLFYATQASGGPGIRIRCAGRTTSCWPDAGVMRLGLLDPGSVCLGGDRVYLNTEAEAR